MTLRVGSRPEDNIKDNYKFWTDYDWDKKGDEWSQSFGGTSALWYGMLHPRVHRFLDCEHILEIAPGHGRCTQFLLPRCRRLTIVDLVPRCIEACKLRFNNDAKIKFVVNDGCSLPETDDQSVDFVFSWDSLVHVDRIPMRGYVTEIARVLRPNGYAFIHHSNLGMQYDQLSEGDKTKGNGLRQPTMSASIMASDCREVGLWCVAQELVPQARPGLYNDCYTLIKKDSDNSGTPPVIRRRDDWPAVVTATKLAESHYSMGR